MNKPGFSQHGFSQHGFFFTQKATQVMDKDVEKALQGRGLGLCCSHCVFVF